MKSKKEKIKLNKIIKGYYEAWNLHEVDKIVSLFTEDGVHEDVAIGAIYHGKDELRIGLSPLFTAFPDFKLELKSIINDEGRLAHEWVMSGTHIGILPGFGASATGKSFLIRGVSITEMRNGKISRNTDYWNLFKMYEQLELKPKRKKNF